MLRLVEGAAAWEGEEGFEDGSEDLGHCSSCGLG